MHSQGHLGIEQAQRDGDLQRKAPQLVQTGKQVNNPIRIHRHEGLHRSAGVRCHVNAAD